MSEIPAPSPPNDILLSEAEILIYRPCLGVGMLRAARAAGQIEWTKGKRGSAWYTLAATDAFIAAHRTISKK